MKPRILILSIVLMTASAAHAGEYARELVDAWSQRMAETESALRSADYARAMKLADKTVTEMAERLGPGEGSTLLFGKALTQKALAHAGIGEEAEAAWYWHIVRGLDPKFAETDLTAFGDIAARFNESCDEHGLSSAINPDAGRIQPPKLVKRRKPKFPHGAHYFGVTGDLVVEVIVTADGRVREPRIVTPLPAATLSYAALEAVKRWQFEPARVGEKPIDVVFNLTVNYKN
jgi:TonB family protein